MCCSPNRVAVRAATHYCPRAWQTLMHVEKNVISSLLYTFPSAHIYFINLFIVQAKYKIQIKTWLIRLNNRTNKNISGLL